MGTMTAHTQPTATRVQSSTPEQVNEQILRHTEATLARAAADRERTDRRLRELSQEWDVERALQTNFAVVGLLSVTLGALLARPWFLLGGVAAGFMIEHAVKGWCPPLPLLRRMGFRTAREIDQERYALKALRGDFEGVTSQDPAKAFEAAAPRPA
jgi:sirohydrochlorin ferrochelatase